MYNARTKKEKLKILVIDWLIILGVYLFVRLMFIMFGLHLNNTLLRICLCNIPLSFRGAISIPCL